MARILAPIIKTLDNLEQLIKDDEGVKALIDGGYGGLEQLRLDILHDFFKSAFDGLLYTFNLSLFLNPPFYTPFPYLNLTCLLFICFLLLHILSLSPNLFVYKNVLCYLSLMSLSPPSFFPLYLSVSCLVCREWS